MNSTTPLEPRKGELSHQFDDLRQQKDSADLGMWAFLLTEVLFFAGLFTAYSLYRWKYPQVWIEGSHMMDIKLGALNTMVLLTSSLTMVFAVDSAQKGNNRAVVGWLIFTMILGATFLGVKGIEYHHKYVEHLIPGRHFQFEVDPAAAPQAQLFFSLYFIMTGLHALHMIIGIGLLTVIAVMAHKGKFSKTYANPVEISGLYWHFVDIVWIFLFPLLYLVGSR
jgi:cytochrome c oxidase subunit III